MCDHSHLSTGSQSRQAQSIGCSLRSPFSCLTLLFLPLFPRVPPAGYFLSNLCSCFTVHSGTCQECRAVQGYACAAQTTLQLQRHPTFQSWSSGVTGALSANRAGSAPLSYKGPPVWMWTQCGRAKANDQGPTQSAAPLGDQCQCGPYVRHFFHPKLFVTLQRNLSESPVKSVFASSTLNSAVCNRYGGDFSAHSRVVRVTNDSPLADSCADANPMSPCVPRGHRGLIFKAQAIDHHCSEQQTSARVGVRRLVSFAGYLGTTQSFGAL